MKKIGIVGSRRRNSPPDKQLVLDAFQKIYDEENGDACIVSGGCPEGADKFAEEIAEQFGMTKKNGRLIIHKPNKPPKGSPYYMFVKAFHARNTLIAEDADILIAVVAENRKGGTENTIETAEKLEKEVRLIFPPQDIFGD